MKNKKTKVIIQLFSKHSDKIRKCLWFPYRKRNKNKKMK